MDVEDEVLEDLERKERLISKQEKELIEKDKTIDKKDKELEFEREKAKQERQKAKQERQKLQTTISNMKESGLSKEEIAKFTGISIDELSKLW